ncbi:hypothetical protein [Bradyrhizobium japonicum]|uniref:hypothetical protein n=1 Tax=Bradyrhizobium japonicum TaxID=375 RepID=UPI001E32A7E4|nr:hypothetical protein [Bradyrhizobium japonicum]MCD9892098.1 hypothetical protein [Bradyrhizobium japonicum]WRJ83872.1 hypothetical protein R3F78_02805 [Bradyrhizobium japonicum]WRJ92852.1 hypothetical protein R3F77_00565 [Bradyrhizobium japonicum]WRK46694.1 hypothetical protein R3F73_00575 [Bradyrhizobium japonicum]
MDKGRNTSQMNVALERLRAERIRHQQTSEYQIKVGPYNFYPGKGTIFVDGEEGVRTERGLDSFVSLLHKLEARAPHLTQRSESREPNLQNGTNGFDLRQAISDPEEADRLFRSIPKSGR